MGEERNTKKEKNTTKNPRAVWSWDFAFEIVVIQRISADLGS